MHSGGRDPESNTPYGKPSVNMAQYWGECLQSQPSDCHHAHLYRCTVDGEARTSLLERDRSILRPTSLKCWTGATFSDWSPCKSSSPVAPISLGSKRCQRILEWLVTHVPSSQNRLSVWLLYAPSPLTSLHHSPFRSVFVPANSQLRSRSCTLCATAAMQNSRFWLFPPTRRRWRECLAFSAAIHQRLVDFKIRYSYHYRVS